MGVLAICAVAGMLFVYAYSKGFADGYSQGEDDVYHRRSVVIRAGKK